MTRDELPAATVLELTGALVADFGALDVLARLTGRCVKVLDVVAAGVMLVAPDGRLRVVASSAEGLCRGALFELQSEEGPCRDCCRTGLAVLNEDLVVAAEARWRRFAPVALEAGFRTVHALPIRWRRRVIGALNLFGSDEPRRDLDGRTFLAAYLQEGQDGGNRRPNRDPVANGPTGHTGSGAPGFREAVPRPWCGASPSTSSIRRRISLHRSFEVMETLSLGFTLSIVHAEDGRRT
jgi:hypothetical protein